MPGVKHVPFGDLKALDQVVDSDTAGVILEPIQGEGGIHLAPDGYLQGVREICTRKKALMVADEVQTGLGRTGRMFAVQHWEVEPDLLVLARPWRRGDAHRRHPEGGEAFRRLIHTSTLAEAPWPAPRVSYPASCVDRRPNEPPPRSWFLTVCASSWRNPDICAKHAAWA